MNKRYIGIPICAAFGIAISLAVVKMLPLFLSLTGPNLVMPLMYAVSLVVASLGVMRLRNWGRVLYVYLMVIWIGIGLTYYLNTASVGSTESFLVFALYYVAPAVMSITYMFSPAIRARYEDAVYWLGKKILVVDDDRGFVKMVKANLNSRGFDVVFAFSGERGIEVAKKSKPHLILLDVILPGIKGRQVCLQLKNDPVTKDIPVVFLTAKYSEDDIKAEMEVGGLSHITKPLDFQRLLAEINRILEIH